MGRFDKKVAYSDAKPTKEQMDSLRWLIGRLKKEVLPHKAVVDTLCPGKDWYDEIL